MADKRKMYVEVEANDRTEGARIEVLAATAAEARELALAEWKGKPATAGAVTVEVDD